MRFEIACFLLAFSVSAQSADRTEKIRALMEAQGLLATFQQQMEMGKENSRRQADQMLSQMFASLNASEKVKSRMESAAGEFMHALEVPWSAQDVVDEWASLY